MKSPNCIYFMPEELTGSFSYCGLFKNVCNGFGEQCLASEPHTKESRQALKEAIEKRKKQREEMK